MTSYDSTSRCTAAAVRIVWPPPVAVTYEEYAPSTVPPSLVLTVNGTEALPPAGTVTEVAPSLKKPAGAAWPFGLVAVDASFSVTSFVPRLRYVSSLVTGLSSVCGHCWTPKLTDAGSAITDCLMAWSTWMRPEPCWNGVYLPPLVEPVRAPFSSAYFHSGCCCFRIAAAPATCGVAIDVPEIVM